MFRSLRNYSREDWVFFFNPWPTYTRVVTQHENDIFFEEMAE